MKRNILPSPDTVARLKEIKVIRLFMLPAMEFKRKHANRKYFTSADAEKLRKLKNAYRDDTCFIIGNGPSLLISDLEKLQGVKTFASNRIYKVFNQTLWRPDFYVAFEPDFVKTNASSLVNIEAKYLFLNMVCKRVIPAKSIRDNVLWLNCYSRFCVNRYTTDNISFSKDLEQYVSDAYSVTFTALQLSVYMGFKQIYLLGVDHYKSGRSFGHFYEDMKTEHRTDTYVEGIEYSYQIAKKAAEELGVKIYNATRGGNLEVFERVDFDKIVKEITVK